jgi:2-succinyl-6-hydroxy-2,4-cyclohexadiene-1-carboxylate synthase
MTDLLNDEQFNEKRLTIFDQKVDELADIIDQILSIDGFEKIVLVGYSMGARLALALSTHLKLQDKIQHMILMGANPGLEKSETEDRWHQDLEWIESLFRSKLSVFLKKWYKQKILSSFEKTSPDRFDERLKAQSLLHHTFGLAYAMYAYSLAHQPNLWPKLNQIKVPTLWLNGALDLKFCEIARQATLLQDTSIAVEIQGFGHQMIFECPELVLEQILLFLRTHQ